MHGLHSNAVSNLWVKAGGRAMQTFDMVGVGLRWSWSESKQNSPNGDRNNRIEGWMGEQTGGATFAQY